MGYADTHDSVVDMLEGGKMNYIIDPSWFYWIGVADGIKVIAVVMMILSIVGLAVCGVIGIYDFCNDDGSEEERKIVRKGAIISAILLTVSAALVIFMPSKTTLIEMQIARMATHDNVAWSVDQIKSIVDYIVEAGKALK